MTVNICKTQIQKTMQTKKVHVPTISSLQITRDTQRVLGTYENNDDNDDDDGRQEVN